MAMQNVPRQFLSVGGGFVDESGQWVQKYHEVTPLEYRKERDRRRTACQAPLSQNKLCVLYLVNRREHRSAWFYTEERARKALELMQTKYGARNCILYRD